MNPKKLSQKYINLVTPNSLGAKLIKKPVNTKIYAVLFSVLLITGCFLALQVNNKINGVVYASPHILNVHLSTDKTSPIKLGVNESLVLTASVNNSFSGKLVYTWSVTPNDNKTELVSDGSSASFKFLKATSDPYSINVQAQDTEMGNLGFTQITVYDPVTFPSLYLDASPATFSYKIASDGLGWYYAVNGSNMQVVTSWSTTNLTALETNCVNAGKGVTIMPNLQHIYGVVIPQGASVEDSINGSKRVYCNSADSEGSPYTISVSNRDVTPTYLAQDSIGRIINSWSSTDAITLLNTVLSNATQGTIMLMNGTFSGSGQITWKSNFNLICSGSATLNVTATGSTFKAVHFSNVRNILWQNVNVMVYGAYQYVRACNVEVGASPKLVNCNFTNFCTLGSGSGLYIANSGGEYNFCTFNGSDYGSSSNYGIYASGTTAKFTGCIGYAGNGTNGIGIYCFSGSPIFHDTIGYGGNVSGSTNNGITLGSGFSGVLSDCIGYGGNGTNSVGITIQGSSGVLTNTFGYGGYGSNAHGITTQAYSTARFYGCSGYGGQGASSSGLYVTGNSKGTFTGCTFFGGTGTGPNGITTGDSASPEFIGCTGYAGNASATGAGGIYVSSASSPKFTGCTGIAGNSSTYGIYTLRASTPIFTGCTAIGAYNGSASYGLAIQEASSPIFNGLTVRPPIFSAKYTYSTSYDGSFNASFYDVSTPIFTTSMTVDVSVATATASVDIGTTVGGNDIANDVTLASTGGKYFNFTRSPYAAAALLYATPNMTVANASFAIYWTYVPNYATSYGISLSTMGHALISSSTIRSNAQSSAVYISGNSITYGNWKISNSHIETMNTTSFYAVEASSAIVDVGIYNSVLVHNVLNVVPDNGTELGSNIQDPTKQRELNTPLSTADITELMQRVKEGTLNPAYVFFTSAKQTLALEDYPLTVAQINANADIVKAAKTFNVVVKEKLGKFPSEIIAADVLASE